ncbi:MAG: hypothetical protein LBJ57_00320, partial [Prevotellaceae bacterium]|nr:hypothetical protein [Prevotellaceae bacterium]
MKYSPNFVGKSIPKTPTLTSQTTMTTMTTKLCSLLLSNLIFFSLSAQTFVHEKSSSYIWPKEP